MDNIETTENTEIENTNTEEQDMENEELAGDDGVAIEGQGVSAEQADEVEASTEAVEAKPAALDEKAKKEKAAAAHLAFVAAAQAHASALGLETKDQKGFFKVVNAATGHKLYVAKQGREVTRIDTTLPMSALDGISYGLSKPNGRIQCHVQATPEAVTLALDVLASYEDKIPAPKKPAGKAQTAAV